MSNIGIEEYLQIKGISEVTIRKLIPSIITESIAQDGKRLGEIIAMDSPFILRSGIALEAFNFPNGTDTISSIYPSGQLIVPTQLACRNECLSEFICKTNIIVEYIDKNTIIEACTNDKNLLELIMFTKSFHLKMSCFFFSIKDVISKEEHICLILAILFANPRFLSHGKLIFTIEELCKFSGVSRQYYSRVLRKLEKTKTISHSYGELKLLSFSNLNKFYDTHLFELLKSFVLQTSVTLSEESQYL